MTKANSERQRRLEELSQLPPGQLAERVVTLEGDLTREREGTHQGLRVNLDRSKISKIDPSLPGLWYRGYSIHDLVRHTTFEEVVHLLLYGELPTQEELAKFNDKLVGSRTIDSSVIDMLRKLPKDAHPMDVLQGAVIYLALSDPLNYDNSIGAIREKTIRLTAQVPTIIMAHNRIRNGQEPITPREDISHAANYLYMLNGNLPESELEALMNVDFILHAEHGSNASAFVARAVTSTRARYHAAVSSAIGSLSGPAHGGAAENVMHMVMEILDIAKTRGLTINDAADAYLKPKWDNREPVMGFGHAVYGSKGDPRALHLRAGLEYLSAKTGETGLYDILMIVARKQEQHWRGKQPPNVDYFAGAIYALLGIPVDLFVPTFAAGRIPGYGAHIIEQRSGINMLVRPGLIPNGPDARELPQEYLARNKPGVPGAMPTK